MGLVRGRDSHVGIQIATEGTTYGTLDTEAVWMDVPIIDTDMDLSLEQAPDSDEISALSARQEVEPGRALAAGSITVRPRPDSVWFNYLLAAATGHEDCELDKWLDGEPDNVGASVIHTHIYSINDTLPQAMQIRLWISGPDTSGAVKLFTGAMVSKITWTQDSTNSPRVTFEFLCKAMTLVPASGATPVPGAPDGTVYAKLRDLARRTSPVIQFASRTEFRDNATGTYTHVKMHNFTLEIDRSMEVEEAIMSSPDDINKPGVTAQREITVSMDGPYDAQASGGRSPYHDYVNQTESGFNVVYVSTTMLAGAVNAAGTPETMPYGMKLNVPNITFTEGSLPVTDGNVLKYSVKGTAVQAAKAYYPDRIGGANDHQIPALGTDVRLLTVAHDTDIVVNGVTDAKSAGGSKWTWCITKDGGGLGGNAVMLDAPV